MKIELSTAEKTDALIVGMYEGDTIPTSAKMSEETTNLITNAIESKEFEGKKDQLLVIDTHATPRKLIMTGLGKKKDYTLESLRCAVHNARSTADSIHLKAIAYDTASIILDKNSFLNGLALGEGASLGQYAFDRFKSEKEPTDHVKQIILISDDKDLLKGAETGLAIATQVKYARDLVNEPANVVKPEYLAKEAKKIEGETGMKVTIHNKESIEKLGLSMLLAVGQGSDNDPQFIVMELNPEKKGGIAIVGKGITFDSGGLNIKPGQWMDYMKSDMAGAASILATMKLASTLGYKERLIGIVASAENMLSGDSMRPGDIVKSFQGKTVEILNTDAEGRLILGDAVAYAETMKPKHIVDVATLTGAAIVTLGYLATPVVGTDEEMIRKLTTAGNASHERIWKLPFWDDYKEGMKSDIADVRNIVKGKGFEAGVISGGIFINEFVKDTPFTHIDIGATGWFPESQHYHPKTATGIPIRMLTYMLMGWE